MTDTAPERVEGEEQHVWDRRKVSEQSKQELAEYIHHGETDKALRKLFRLQIGEQVADHPPTRDMSVAITVNEPLADNERIGLEIGVDGETRTVFVPADGSEVRFGSFEDGEYGLSASGTVLRESSGDGLEHTETTIESAEITMPTNATIDTKSSAYGSVATAKITVESVTLEGSQ